MTAFNLALLFFLVIAGFHLWYAFGILYHLLRFGIGVVPKLLALVFFLGSILAAIIVFLAFNLVDWQNVFNFLP
jgi:hypothetical protein